MFGDHGTKFGAPVAFHTSTNVQFSQVPVCIMVQGSEYFPKFYFFADAVATLSILLDIKWIVDLSDSASDLERTAAVCFASSAEFYLPLLSFSNALSYWCSQSAVILPCVAKASRIAARAARLLKLQRLVKVVRVFRAMKMLKYITAQLSKLLAVYIVVLIMILLICTPLLEYDEVDRSVEAMANALYAYRVQVDEFVGTNFTSGSPATADLDSEATYLPNATTEQFFDFYKNLTNMVLFEITSSNVTVRQCTPHHQLLV